MDFNKLNSLIPKEHGKIHSKTIYLAGGFGWSVRVKYPGKHLSTKGDFLVEVLSEGAWDSYHKISHAEMFEDVLQKLAVDADFCKKWVLDIMRVVNGSKPLPSDVSTVDCGLPGMHQDALSYAMLALAVNEHRRHPGKESEGGGRYLPLNFLLALIQGHWDIDKAKRLMRIGQPILERLNDFRPFTGGDSPINYYSQVHVPALVSLREV